MEPLTHEELVRLVSDICAGHLIDFSPILQNKDLREYLQLESHHIVSVYAEKGGADGFVLYVDNRTSGIKTPVTTVNINGCSLEVSMSICCQTFICPDHFSGMVYELNGVPRIIKRIVQELQEAQLAPLIPKSKYPQMNASLRVPHSIGFY